MIEFPTLLKTNNLGPYSYIKILQRRQSLY